MHFEAGELVGLVCCALGLFADPSKPWKHPRSLKRGVWGAGVDVVVAGMG
jgi:hypothetical protein